jgi:hypothetical protein
MDTVTLLDHISRMRQSLDVVERQLLVGSATVQTLHQIQQTLSGISRPFGPLQYEYFTRQVEQILAENSTFPEVAPESSESETSEAQAVGDTASSDGVQEASVDKLPTWWTAPPKARKATENPEIETLLQELRGSGRKWTAEEDRALLEGIVRHGYGNWASIQQDSRLSAHRKPSALKDRVVNMRYYLEKNRLLYRILRKPGEARNAPVQLGM